MNHPHTTASLPPTPAPFGYPAKQGLYDPAFEKDACGVGFVVNIKGERSHDIVRQAMTVLVHLNHRGACGCEANTGDGAGINLQLPDKFLRRVAAECGCALPPLGQYGVGMVFLPKDADLRRTFEQEFEQIVAEEGQTVLGWRTVPTNNQSLGETAQAGEPFIRQVFIGRNEQALVGQDALAFERKLYVIRKRAERAIRYNGHEHGNRFYIASLSSRTLVYKGMLLAEQVEEYYPDLVAPDMEAAIAVVHSRFSTNTFPSWERAHPYRYLIHNGEINTIRGNVNWMYARQSVVKSDLFGPDLDKVRQQIIDPDGSDSAQFDNAMEFLHLAGRPLHHVAMMMIPEPWSNHESMSPAKKAFYEYHATMMEPWDGPASIVFTDGTVVGAVLDRNGLRPSRYYVTQDGIVVMASEVGVLGDEIAPENVAYKARLQPGRMFLVDTAQGRIIADEEIKETMAWAHPYQEWLDANLVELDNLPEPPDLYQADLHDSVLHRQHIFGYTFETLRTLIAPMARNGVEALGSMGDDAPVAVLSDRPQLLYTYFRQLFAQVTNPPLDAIREELVTATDVMMGTEGNILETAPENCRQIRLKNPILTNVQLAKLAHIKEPGFKSQKLPMIFPIKEGWQGLERALDYLFMLADEAIEQGVNIFILSDRGVSREMAPIPALLATAGLHHHLIRQETRTQCAILVESGEPREVHHFALLIGYGATAVNPYMAFETIYDLIDQGIVTDITYEKARAHYIKSAMKGVIKVCSKMGISTLQSYCGAQIFEALGLSRKLVDKYFTWTPTRIEGIGLEQIYEEVKMRHLRAYPDRADRPGVLVAGGDYQWRAEGERHLFNPLTIHKLQAAVRTRDGQVWGQGYRAFKEYSRLVDEQERGYCTLRGLLDFKFAETPIPLDEVEPASKIVKRFKTGAMSYGSISQEAHETLAIAMNRLGGRSNTGEGGEDPARYGWTNERGDSKNSAIKQVASGRFGVTSQYLVQARELQIKMAQGAKPGEGGQLPGAKVYPWIAKVRHSTPGVGLISPPPHHDIYSIEDLGELIHDLKNANHHARISVKLVSEVGVGTIAAGVAKGHADVILISGHDGGTGASPQSSIKHAGLPWELGIAETHQTLVLNKLRSRVALETDGQLKTGRDVAIAALLGAEEFGFATTALVSMGCIMMRVCHLDTCPAGVATQNPELRQKFVGQPEDVENFMYFVAAELREIMARLGFRTVNEMVGRVDRLEPKRAVAHWKARGIDLSPLLWEPPMGEDVGRYCQIGQDHGLDKSLDRTTLLALAQPALDRGEKVQATLAISNVNRVVGTMVGSEVTRRYGACGLPEDTIHFTFQGSAGQSFGAFIPRGMTLELEGDANDYYGKGLSGGKLIAYPPVGSPFRAEENIIVGNVALYGATDGDAYIRGMAGERFAVRNSGARAVVEGVGDHGCEYMTGGQVVVLGKTGRNFAAGMSGGMAYVIDWEGDFKTRVNFEMVGLEPLCDPDEIAAVRALIEKHAEYTNSDLAGRVLARWDELLPKVVKILPKDYKRVLEAYAEVTAQGLSGDEAVMAAFERNKRDAARVGGN
ncbi:MAG: glutamate synthase large subunit [Caldilineales bacterium]|nr:glutamate synthase large subunit [Caldilineales bacterium]MCW5858481.1 glutamate synthase large subunit [Caldilineales bacterium]